MQGHVLYLANEAAIYESKYALKISFSRPTRKRGPDKEVALVHIHIYINTHTYIHVYILCTWNVLPVHLANVFFSFLFFSLLLFFFVFFFFNLLQHSQPFFYYQPLTFPFRHTCALSLSYLISKLQIVIAINLYNSSDWVASNYLNEIKLTISGRCSQSCSNEIENVIERSEKNNERANDRDFIKRFDFSFFLSSTTRKSSSTI